MSKALLVVDVQEDYFSESRNKKRFCYENIDALIQNINHAIRKSVENGDIVIYIAQIVPNTLFFRKLLGFTLKGTDGAKLFHKLDIVSDHYFEKTFPSAFSDKQLCLFIKKKGITTIEVCGIDEAACVSATAKSGVKLGLEVTMTKNAVDTVFPKKAENIRHKLAGKGVIYI